MKKRGFTLVELLVSMTILSLILVLMLSIINQISTLWKKTSGKISAFQEARSGFESVTRKLSQATLNTYFDYVDSTGKTRAEVESGGGAFTPDKYVRQSELHFITGPSDMILGDVKSAKADFNPLTHSVFFQAPLGYSNSSSELKNLLNAKGFFIEYSDDQNERPKFITNLPALFPLRLRYRLMELYQPTEELSVYNQTSSSLKSSVANQREWFLTPMKNGSYRLVANNIIALIILPKNAGTSVAPLSTDYQYDTRQYLNANTSSATTSRNQLPPIIQVTMVALDEASSARLTDADHTEIQNAISKLFQDSAKYQSDLVVDALNGGESLEELLIRKKLNYNIFTTYVTIRQAKWSGN